MTEYNARIEVAHRNPSDAWYDRVLDALDGYSPAISHSPAGLVEVVITVQANALRVAFVSACALVRDATGMDVVVGEVMPTDEWDRRQGLSPIPDLLSVTQAAERLGTSRQAVLQRISTGSLPAQKVGDQWAIQAAAVRAPSHA